MDQRHDLAARQERARAVTQIDHLVGQCFQPQVLGQRSGQQQPGISHRVLVVEGHSDPVKTVRNSHRKDALLEWTDVVVRNHIIPAQGASFADTRPTRSNPQR
jgi:hypothetical protein